MSWVSTWLARGSVHGLVNNNAPFLLLRRRWHTKELATTREVDNRHGLETMGEEGGILASIRICT